MNKVSDDSFTPLFQENKVLISKSTNPTMVTKSKEIIICSFFKFEIYYNRTYAFGGNNYLLINRKDLSCGQI